jgi:hypothetical protein
MITPLTLSMPTSDRFRELAVDSAAKYAELCGCAAPAIAAMTQAIAAELGARASKAAPDANLTLACRSDRGQVDVVIDGAGPAATVHCAIP